MRLAKKIAIVTGTSPNIGGGIAEGLAEEGATVACVDVTPDNALQCAEAIRRRGGEALGIACDVTDESQVEAMVATGPGGLRRRRHPRRQRGHPRRPERAGDAGRAVESPDRRSTSPATFLCTKHVARLMVEQKRRGTIVVVVSTAGHQGQAGNIAYSTSKSGLLNFTRAAAMDLARHGIRVNSLTPTATDTEEAADRAVAWGRPRPEPRARGLDFPKMVPMGKLPSPRHYARAVVFLASDDAEMITGTDLRVDAGAIAKYWPWIPNA